jgi:hypothetical protein
MPNATLIRLTNLSWLLLTVGCGIWASERVAFSDSAYYLFQMTQNQTWALELHRYSAFIPQTPALLAIWAELPLIWVVQAFSLGYILLFVSIYYIITYYYKCPEAGMTLLLAFVLFIQKSFFHTVTETHQAIAYALGLYAALGYTRNKAPWKLIAIASIWILLGFFSHPVSLFLNVFVIAWRTHDTRSWKKVWPWLLIASLGIMYGLKVMFTDSNSYEGNLFDQIKSAPALLPKLFSLPMISFVKDNLIGFYAWYLFIAASVLFCWLWKKDFYSILACFGAGLIFLIISLITYNQGNSPIMLEKNFMPYALFLGLPFIKECLVREDSIFPKSLRYQLWGVLIFAGFTGLYSTAQWASSRTHWIDNMLTQARARGTEQHYIIERKQLPAEIIHVDWALAPETLILSSLKYGPEGVITFFRVDSFASPPTDLSVTDLYMSTDFWLIWNAYTLNQNYFKFRAGHYIPWKDKL